MTDVHDQITDTTVREIAAELMLDAARQVADFTITDRLAGDVPEADRFAVAEKVRELIAAATVAVEVPEAAGS